MSFSFRIFKKTSLNLSFICVITILLFSPLKSLLAVTLERASVSSLGVQGDLSSSFGADGIGFLSQDGRYVVFRSVATNLVSGDTNGVGDIFVYDRQTETTERVSVDSNGVEANAQSFDPSISYDGRYVVFGSSATNLVSGDTNGVGDIFVYDRQTETTERVSVDSNGVEANGTSLYAFISGNGRYVVFGSQATNLDLVTSDTNSSMDIFLHDRNSGETERVSKSSSGVEADMGIINSATISEDGRYVAFASPSTNLVPGYSSGNMQIYVKDRDTEDLEIVSIDNVGTEGDSSSRQPFISGNGRYVSFESLSMNLVAGDTTGSGSFDIFVYDRQTDTISRVSINNDGEESDGTNQDVSISHDGRYVFFWSNATNLTSAITGGIDHLFVYDTVLETIQLVSSSVSGILANSGSRYGSISSSGLYITFSTSANNLVDDDTNSTNDVFVRSINYPPSDIMLSPSSVSENENPSTPVGNFTATDINDNDTETFSLSCTTSGADDGSFSVSGDLLITEETFDFETKSSYAICVRATDSEGATYDENITITINDLDESSGGGGGGGGPESSDDTPEPTPDPEPNPTPVPEPTPEPEPAPEPTPETLPEPETPPSIPTPETTPTNDLIPSDENHPADNTSPFSDVKDTIEHEFELIKLGLQEETPRDIANTVSVAGVALPTIAFVVAQPAVAANLVSIPIRLWNLIPIWLGLRRRKRPWGTVYDSVTKQPLDPVYVSLRSLNGREVATTITDMDGRFGFLVPPGRYKIVAKKDNYDFPSKKLAGKETDDLYGSLYDGGEIEISGEESLVIKNIPMDSTSFNWNEFEKTNNKQLMKFYSKREIFLAHIAGVAFWGGLVSSLVLLVTGPSTLNYILLGVYAVVFILRLFGVTPKKPGYISEAETGFPLSFGLVKVYSNALKKEIAHAIIGKTGKYYVLVPNGEYYVKIEKKIGEDEYKEVYLSDPFRVKKGFIGQNFNI